MGSTNFTEHYDIPLPLGSDKTTPMDYNQSMQAVDTALFTAQGDASDAKTGLATTNQNVAQNAQNINALAGRVTTVEGTVSSQGTAITNLGTKVDGVEQDAQDMICAYNQASATASRNYAVGDYFIYNDVLYRVTQAIASGGTIVPDTNCTTTNVTSEIKSQSSNIAQLNSDLAGVQNRLNLAKLDTGISLGTTNYTTLADGYVDVRLQYDTGVLTNKIATLSLNDQEVYRDAPAADHSKRFSLFVKKGMKIKVNPDGGYTGLVGTFFPLK